MASVNQKIKFFNQLFLTDFKEKIKNDWMYFAEVVLRTMGSLQGAETSCVCVCTKRVCVSNTKPKACTVGIYST